MREDYISAPETKADDVNGMIGTLCNQFEHFKDANEERITQIERKMGNDPLTLEKIERLNQAMDAQKALMEAHVLKQSRPGLEIGGNSRDNQEYKQAFGAYMRRGDARLLEQKSLSVGVNSDGGFTVPLEIDAEIGKRLFAISPIRAIATVQQVSSNIYRKPFSTDKFSSGWVAETGARAQTNNPSLAALDFPTNELYAMPAATQALLDDSAVNLDEWIAQEVETAFAIQEGTAFVTGDGTNKPKGFLSYTNAAETSFAWGGLGFITTGAAAAMPASNPSDKLIELMYTLKAGYRQNGTFVMNRKTQSVIRQYKDSTGNYLWSPPTGAEASAKLLGFNVVESEDMPDIGANTTPIAFGDFRRGYVVVDRIGTRILRDPYSAKPYVLFYVTKRVGGGVQDFDAIKLLKVSV